MEPITRRITTAKSPRRIPIEWEDWEEPEAKYIHSPNPTKGVSWDKTRNKWRAQACYRGKKYALGRYDDYDDAVRARKEFRGKNCAYER